MVGLLFKAGKTIWVGFQYSHLENSLYRSYKREGTRERKKNGRRKGTMLCVMLWQTGNSTDTPAQWSRTRRLMEWPALCHHNNCLLSAWMHPASQYFSFPQVQFSRSLWKGKLGWIIFMSELPAARVCLPRWLSGALRHRAAISVLGLRSSHSHTFKSFNAHNVPLYGLSSLITKVIHVNGSK